VDAALENRRIGFTKVATLCSFLMDQIAGLALPGSGVWCVPLTTLCPIEHLHVVPAFPKFPR